MSAENPRVDAKISAIACSSVHQSLIAAGTESGSIGLFRNTGGIDFSPNRAMLRFSVQEGVGQRGHNYLVTALQFLEEHILVSSSRDGTIKLWDCTNNTHVLNVLNINSRDSVTALSVMNSSTIIASGSAGGYVNVRDIRFNSGELDKGMKARSSEISALALSANDFEVTAADSEGNIDVWDIRSTTNIPLLSLDGHETAAKAGKITEIPPVGPKSSTKTFVSEEIWDVAMGKKRKESGFTEHQKSISFPQHASKGRSMEPAHKGKVLALGRIDSGIIGSVSIDKSAKLFCRLTGTLLGVCKFKEKPICAALHGGVMCIGKREGFEVVNPIRSQLSSAGVNNTSTHVGPVSAATFVGDWGICTGGTDRHIFVHRIEI
jgi:WD40 repeat protein